MSPSPEHEKITELVLQLVRGRRRTWHAALETLLGRRLEAPVAAARRRARPPRSPASVTRCASSPPRIDLETDPPPAAVVEIEVTNESLTKFSVYAPPACRGWAVQSHGDPLLQRWPMAPVRPAADSLSFPGHASSDPTAAQSQRAAAKRKLTSPQRHSVSSCASSEARQALSFSSATTSLTARRPVSTAPFM